MISDLRQAIIAQLSPLSNEARIIGDDTEGEAGSTNTVKSDYVIRVGYSGGQFTPPESTEFVGLQECERSFQISIEIRDLRSEYKAIQLLEKVEQLILGLHPCVGGASGVFYLVSDNFQQNRDGIYYYVIQASVNTVEVKN